MWVWNRPCWRSEDIALKLYSINVGIVVENPVDRWPRPSVLGMDVLSRWRVTLEPREGVFEIEPKNADLDELKTEAHIHGRCKTNGPAPLPEPAAAEWIPWATNRGSGIPTRCQPP